MSAGDVMTGTRVYGKSPHELAPGEYGRWEHDGNNWYASTPTGMLANLTNHGIAEHADGDITVSPSILVQQPHPDGELQWHGFLERGVWREV